MNTNSSVIVGNLTKAPDLRYTNSQKAVAKFNIAVNGYKEEDVSFIPVQIWGKQAENCDKYLDKGSKVAVSGGIRQERWETKNGQKRSRIIVNAQSVEFLSRKKEVATAQQNQKNIKQKTNELIDEGDQHEDQEEIPF